MIPYLEEALDLAAQGLGRVSPNPAVGAVIVRDDVVVGRGFHTWAGVKHAEVLALEEAGELARGSRPTAHGSAVALPGTPRLPFSSSWRV